MSWLQKVIDRYNALLLERGRKRGYLRYSTKKTQEEVESYIAWCHSKGVHPVRFMEARFAHADEHGFSHLLSLKRLRSNKFSSYEDLAEWADRLASDRRFTQDEMKKQDRRLRLSLKKLNPHQERFKSFYQGRQELCVRFIEHSGGYHPRSAYCAPCPEQTRCCALAKQHYGFDVISLRRNP